MGNLENGHCLDATIRPSWCRLSSRIWQISRERVFLPHEYRTGAYQYLQDTYAFWHESVVGDSTIITTLHDMIRDTATIKIPYSINVCYFTTVTRDVRFTFWLCYCLDRFKGVWNRWVFATIWTCRFMQPLDLNFLKAFITRWSTYINSP